MVVGRQGEEGWEYGDREREDGSRETEREYDCRETGRMGVWRQGER